jgi:prepilin-type N-terminal cleavage/methylation domain-containing protein
MRRGFSMVEISISTVIISMLMIAALSTVGAAARRGVNTANLVRGKLLASDLMNEILRQCYQDPNVTPVFGPEPGETTQPATRAKFNDVDDYVGWTESPPADKNGVPYAGFNGWTRSVNVQWANPTTLAPSAASNTGLKLVTVTASQGGKNVVTTVGYRSVAWSDTIPSPSDTTGNHPPVAVIGGNNFIGFHPLNVSFTGTSSYDPDGDYISYVWSFGDGATGNGATTSHTYSASGAYTATLTVYDGRGGVGTDSQAIWVIF